MNVLQTIARKRDGKTLHAEEITDLVRGYATGQVPDYQMAAWAMAVYLRDMDRQESIALTRAMLHSGSVLEGGNRALRVDKHSTGGVGDKTSFIVAPLLTCCGLQVPMVSGRSLGPTGGTLDKLESIPGLRTNLSLGEMQEIVNGVGCFIAGTTEELVPADRKLYALREVTGTIASFPLITASILSKKLAENLSALVLDVKFGSGAFMKTRGQARHLAESMVGVARQLGLEATARIDGHGPASGSRGRQRGGNRRVTGNSGGQGTNRPARDVLGARHGDTIDQETRQGCRRRTDDTATSLGQGARPGEISRNGGCPGRRPGCPATPRAAWPFCSTQQGMISSIDTERLGYAIVEMGGGRIVTSDQVDHSVGLEMLVRLGDRVVRGQPLLNIFAHPEARDRALPLLKDCVTIGEQVPTVEPLIAERILAPPDDLPPAHTAVDGAT